MLINCEEGGDGGVYHLLASIIDIFSIGVGIAGVIGLSLAGIQYLTAGGSEDKTIKAKRRIYEVVIGVACYALIWTGLQWLLPGGALNPGNDNTNVTDIAISYSGNATVGKAFFPTVTFNDDAKDKTYSIVSEDTSIITTMGTHAKCSNEGKANIKAVAANKASASISITCNASNDESSSNSSDSGFATTGSTEDTKLNGSPNLRKETKKIIEDHRKDFYWNTYDKVVKKYGGYKGYVKSLGGVFADYADAKRIKVTTAADLQAAAEYVWGLWAIWGPDYIAGTRVNWVGNDAFYKGDPNRNSHPYTSTSSINTVLSKSGSHTIDTHCNKTIHVFMKSTNLKSINTGSGHTNIQNKLKESGYYSSKLITNISQLRVGDLMNFELGGTAGHVVLVGEVYKDYIVVYDGGRRFMTNSGKYKYKIKRVNGSSLSGSPYSGAINWYGYRPWKIDQNVTLKGIN